MKKKYKRTLWIIALLILLLIIAIIVFDVLKKEDGENNFKVIDSIDNFSYTLDDRDTKLMKDTYNELKRVLNNKDFAYEDYAKYLSQLFIIDLFTMNNKTNKYDVGGTEYIYPESIENFKINVEDTIYKTMENNSNGKRRQILPTVKSVNVSEVKNAEYTLKDNTYESFIVNINWEYEEELGYDNKAEITLIKQDEKLYIVEYTTGE